MNTWEEFITELTTCDVLSTAKRLAFEEWGEDIPTTVLFGKLGKAIADHVEEMDAETTASIFKTIDVGLASSETTLKTLVATGLLEALYLQASRTPGRWDRISRYLEPLSIDYLLEWMRKNH